MNDPTTKEEALRLLNQLQSKFSISKRDINESFNKNNILDDNKNKQTIFILNDADFITGKYSKYKDIVSTITLSSAYFEKSIDFSNTDKENHRYTNFSLDFLINQKNTLSSQAISAQPYPVTLRSGITTNKVNTFLYQTYTTTNMNTRYNPKNSNTNNNYVAASSISNFWSDYHHVQFIAKQHFFFPVMSYTLEQERIA